MASIKGYEAKAVKTFMGEDTGGFTANLYLNNKKIGFIADYGYGGPLTIDVNKEDYDNLTLAGDSYLNETGSKYNSIDIFVDNIVSLKEIESIFKKENKKSKGSIVELSDNFTDKDGNSKPAKVPVTIFVPENYTGNINEDKFDNVRQYHTLSDFIIK